MDESIRLSLAEKQKIVCDIFKVPNEHFSAIADIAGQPEAPKVNQFIQNIFYLLIKNVKLNKKSCNNIQYLSLIQEPSDILLAAFAQVQSLTEALNEYIKIPQIQPTDMIIKSASLCDDCFKTADKKCQEQQSNQTASPQCNTNKCQSPTTSNVISDKLTESTTSIEGEIIILDDDGYCEIDEIRLPAINKPASVKINDPRRQSAPAPLPPDTEDNDELSSKTETAINSEQVSISSSNSTSCVSNNTVISNDPTDSEHIDINRPYDTLSQPLAELNLNADINTLQNNTAENLRMSCSILPPDFSLVETQIAVPSVPCHLISAYVASLNLHISQLLVSTTQCILISLKCHKN